MSSQAQIQNESLQPRSQSLDIVDDLDEVANEEAAMDGVNPNLNLLDPVEGAIGHFDAQVALQVLAVRARFVAVKVVLIENGACFSVDLARDAEDAGG